MTTTRITGTAAEAVAEAAGPQAAGAAPDADGLGQWRARALSTRPADRAAAEEGIRRAYRAAGLPEPEEIRWARSPLEAVRTIRETRDTGPGVRRAIRDVPWERRRARLRAHLGHQGWSAHWAATGGRLGEATRTLVEQITTAVVREDTGRDTGPGTAAVRLLLAEAALGQHDAPWLAAFLAGDAGESGNATSGAAAGPGAAGASGTQGTGGGDGTEEDDDGTDAALDALAAVCRSAGWWWPFARVAVVCERPVALRRDEAGRLDCATGPALGFADGLALYAWRGMPVPAGFLDELSSLTPERIRAEENAELRRVTLEHYGYDRYLTDSGARPVHRDGTGVLWRVELPGDEPVVMVEVVNATPEPDGTRAPTGCGCRRPPGPPARAWRGPSA